MNKIFLLIVTTIMSSTTFAQSIFPNPNTEFCPLVNITFTVTLPRISNNTTPNVISWTNGPIVVSGVNNIVNTSTQTTFSFVGRFRDVNINQVFRVQYATSSNPSATYDPQFKKIKSLFYSTTSTAFPPCNVIRPNQIQPVVFPRCQAATATISFPNIQWFTNFENPEICFGTVTDYEYQLPSGWSIAGNPPSNGSNWIAGGNSVVVTSDLSTGDGADIRIRASNKTCGTGLAANGPVSTVRISRPAPTLSITATGNQTTLCSIGSNATLSINGMPNGATVQWTLSNTDASIPGCSTCPTVSVTRSTSVNTTVRVTATVTHCTFTYTKTMDIVLGVQTPSNIYGMQPTLAVSQGELLELEADNTGMTSYNWSVEGGTIRGYSNLAQVTIEVDRCSGQYNGWLNVHLFYQNACGTGDTYTEYTMIDCSSGGGPLFAMSPNPASENVTIDGRQKNKSIKEVKIIDKIGNVKKIVKYSGDQKLVNLNISELSSNIYFIKIYDGQKWESKQLRVQ